MADDDGRSRAGLPRKTLKIAVPTVAALGAGAAFAVAAIPDSNGVIHGCVERTATGPNGFPGSLRVIDGGNECANSETPLDWNQQGPAGPAGQPGQQGQQGPKGDKGDPGDADGSQTPTPTSHVFLKLDGVEGSSQDPAHKGQSDVLSLSWGSYRNGSIGPGSGGGGATGALFRDVHVQKLHDRSSPKLFKASVTG